MSKTPTLPPALHLFDLTGRTALITGSSAGIGLALARGLLSAGARVILNGRQEDRLEQAGRALRTQFSPNPQDPERVLHLAFDVTSSEAVDTAIDVLERQHGPIDILINNAGMTHRAPLDQFPTEQWHQIMRTNLDSAFFVARALARHMIPRGHGKIVNICSVQSELGRPGIAPYAASKGGHRLGQTRPSGQRTGARLFQDRVNPGLGGRCHVQQLARQPHPQRALGASRRPGRCRRIFIQPSL